MKLKIQNFFLVLLKVKVIFFCHKNTFSKLSFLKTFLDEGLIVQKNCLNELTMYFPRGLEAVVILLIYFCSKILLNIFYSSISTEILRVGQICFNTQNFLPSVKSVIDAVYTQGANMDKVSRTLKKVYCGHNTLKQFAQNAAHFADSLI